MPSPDQSILSRLQQRLPPCQSRLEIPGRLAHELPFKARHKPHVDGDPAPVHVPLVVATFAEHPALTEPARGLPPALTYAHDLRHEKRDQDLTITAMYSPITEYLFAVQKAPETHTPTLIDSLKTYATRIFKARQRLN